MPVDVGRKKEYEGGELVVARSQLWSESEEGEPYADVTDQLDCGAFRICTTLQAWHSGDLEGRRGEKYAAAASEIGNQEMIKELERNFDGNFKEPSGFFLLIA